MNEFASIRWEKAPYTASLEKFDIHVYRAEDGTVYIPIYTQGSRVHTALFLWLPENKALELADALRDAVTSPVPAGD